MKIMLTFLLLIPNLIFAHDSKNLSAPPHYEYDNYQKSFIVDSYAKRIHLTRELIRCITNWEAMHDNNKATCKHTAHFLNLTNAMIHEDGAFEQPLQPGSLPQ